jgi:Uncharacterised protein family (UPF0183)
LEAMPTIPPSSSLQIQPGEALGPLSLSASLYSTLTTLLQHKSAFPRLNISFSSASPVSNPVYIELDTNGLRLRFDGESQRLELIEVTEFGKVGLLYGESNLRYILVSSLLISVAMDHLHFDRYTRRLDRLLLESCFRPLHRRPKRTSSHILALHSNFLFHQMHPYLRQTETC